MKISAAIATVEEDLFPTAVRQGPHVFGALVDLIRAAKQLMKEHGDDYLS